MPSRSSGVGPVTTDELTIALGGSITSTTAVAEVARRLLDYFTGDAIEPGDRLPPERQLAASMGVGRSAIREALAALELLGVVTVRPGSGTYLRGRASELLPQTLSWGMLIGAPKTKELIEVRHGLEVQAARRAAGVISDEALAELGGYLVEMESNKASFDQFVAADMKFHQAIALAAGNSLLDEMLQSVRSLIRLWVERALNDTGHAQLTCNEHRTILTALATGDPEQAAAAMSVHMDSAAARLLPTLEEYR
ncbi:FadR/GntR family transcriptional regulator [Auraticoccus monumenti]|nr:FadR/GntR family transcriptional regulator [Auraticoccus monumenti]